MAELSDSHANPLPAHGRHMKAALRCILGLTTCAPAAKMLPMEQIEAECSLTPELHSLTSTPSNEDEENDFLTLVVSRCFAVTCDRLKITHTARSSACVWSNFSEKFVTRATFYLDNLFLFSVPVHRTCAYNEARVAETHAEQWPTRCMCLGNIIIAIGILLHAQKQTCMSCGAQSTCRAGLMIILVTCVTCVISIPPSWYP